MRFRALALLALSMGCGSVTVEEDADETPVEAAATVQAATQVHPVANPVETPSEVATPPPTHDPPPYVPEQTRWTVPRAVPLAKLERMWGIRTRELRRLNPELRALPDDTRTVEAGTRLRIFGPPGGAASRSLGRPNHGRLRYAQPMPEGEAWALRVNRRRAWATPTTIGAVRSAALAYRARYPGGHPIVLGEFSRRMGGRVSPHKSHQSGRDVDIGYVMEEAPRADGRFVRLRKGTLDVERTWFFLRELLRSGEVQQVFVGLDLQRVLYEHALQNTDPHELTRYFRLANGDDEGRRQAIIRYQRGHHDHMHVRFRCPPGHPRCRG